MKTVDRYMTEQFVPIFSVGLLLFVFLLELIDLFANLWRYLTYDATLAQIVRLSLLYAPKCVSYAMPVSLLFASAYVLGSMYARNELIVFFTSGLSLGRVVRAFLFIGAASSLFMFWFDDAVVIGTSTEKAELSRTLLHQTNSVSGADVVLKTDGGRLVYSADYYNDADRSLSGLVVVERDGNGAFESLIIARKARWRDEEWVLEGATAYVWRDGLLVAGPVPAGSRLVVAPDAFRRRSTDVAALRRRDAAAFIQDLAAAGLPTAGAKADYYRRYAFAATPLIVVFLSLTMGGRYRKNVLLMSLLMSLVSAVIFYVAQMLSMMLAKLGYLPPAVGAWAPAFLFAVAGAALLGSART